MIKNAKLNEIAQNLVFLKETRTVLIAFEQKNIPATLLKGIALVEMVYPHIGARDMTDIDILVKEKDTALASQQLQDLGYELRSGVAPPTYTKKGKIPVTIELHNQGLPYVSDDELWADLMPVTIDGVKGYTLSLEQNIIYLCYHLALCHVNPQKKWLEDIYRMITHFQAEINWVILADKIKHYRLEAPCYHAFFKTREVFHSCFPEDFLSDIKPKHSLKARIFHQLITRPKPDHYVPLILPFLFYPKLIFTRLFPSRSFLNLRYKTQQPFVYIYYLLRPSCLLLKSIQPFARLLFMLLKNNNIFRNLKRIAIQTNGSSS